MNLNWFSWFAIAFVSCLLFKSTSGDDLFPGNYGVKWESNLNSRYYNPESRLKLSVSLDSLNQNHDYSGSFSYQFTCKVCNDLDWQDIITIYENIFVLDGSKTSIVNIADDLESAYGFDYWFFQTLEIGVTIMYQFNETITPTPSIDTAATTTTTTNAAFTTTTTYAPYYNTTSYTYLPTYDPSSSPSNEPSAGTGVPTNDPTMPPATGPSFDASAVPTNVPIIEPTWTPSENPSNIPSTDPSRTPSRFPSKDPTVNPTKQPSIDPSYAPSMMPSSHPSTVPTSPSVAPTNNPSSDPTKAPSVMPTATRAPTNGPSLPTHSPTQVPSVNPTSFPSKMPSADPSNVPSILPTIEPSKNPSSNPTNMPSNEPTRIPTKNPTKIPSDFPSKIPTRYPVNPTNYPVSPTSNPVSPTSNPVSPTNYPVVPTGYPAAPTSQPASPTSYPVSPTNYPVSPTSYPVSGTNQPSNSPSDNPSATFSPTVSPNGGIVNPSPSMLPTPAIPTDYPVSVSTAEPTPSPVHVPTMMPINQTHTQQTVGRRVLVNQLSPSSVVPTRYYSNAPTKARRGLVSDGAGSDGYDKVVIAMSSFSIKINVGPFNGTCMITIDGDDGDYGLSSCMQDVSKCRIVQGDAFDDIFDIYCMSFVDLNGDYPLTYEFVLFSDVDDSIIETAKDKSGNFDTILESTTDIATGTIIQSESVSAFSRLFVANAGNYVIRTIISDTSGSFALYDTAIVAASASNSNSNNGVSISDIDFYISQILAIMSQVNCTFRNVTLNIDINELLSAIVIVDNLLDKLNETDTTSDYGLDIREIMIDTCVAILDCYLLYDSLYFAMRLNDIEMLLDGIDVSLSNSWQINDALVYTAFESVTKTMFYSFDIFAQSNDLSNITEAFDSSFCNRVLKANSRVVNYYQNSSFVNATMSRLNAFALSLAMINKVNGEVYSFENEYIYAFARKMNIDSLAGWSENEIFSLNEYFGYQMPKSLLDSMKNGLYEQGYTNVDDLIDGNSNIDLISMDSPARNSSTDLICDTIDFSLRYPVNYVSIENSTDDEDGSGRRRRRRMGADRDRRNKTVILVSTTIGNVTVNEEDDLLNVSTVQQVSITSTDECDPIILLLPLTSDGGSSVANSTANDAAETLQSWLDDVFANSENYDGTDIYTVDSAILSYPGCIWWDDSTGSWSDAECILYGYTNEYAICLCTHLTSFSLRLQDYEPKVNIISEDTFIDFDFSNVINYPFPTLVVVGLWLLVFICIKFVPNKEDLPLFAVKRPLAVEERHDAFMKTQIGKEFVVLYSKSSKYSKQSKTACRKQRRCLKLCHIRCKNQSILLSICCASKGSNYSTNERITGLFVLVFTVLAVSAFLFGIQQTNAISEYVWSTIAGFLSWLPCVVYAYWIKSCRPTYHRKKLWQQTIDMLDKESGNKNYGNESNANGNALLSGNDAKHNMAIPRSTNDGGGHMPEEFDEMDLQPMTGRIENTNGDGYAMPHSTSDVSPAPPMSMGTDGNYDNEDEYNQNKNNVNDTVDGFANGEAIALVDQFNRNNESAASQAPKVQAGIAAPAAFNSATMNSKEMEMQAITSQIGALQSQLEAMQNTQNDLDAMNEAAMHDEDEKDDILLPENDITPGGEDYARPTPGGPMNAPLPLPLPGKFGKKSSNATGEDAEVVDLGRTLSDNTSNQGHVILTANSPRSQSGDMNRGLQWSQGQFGSSSVRNDDDDEYSGSDMWQGYRPEHCDLYIDDLNGYKNGNKMEKLKLSKKINSHFKRRKRLLRILHPCPHCCRSFATAFAILWMIMCSGIIILYGSWFYAQYDDSDSSTSSSASSSSNSGSSLSGEGSDGSLITIELIEQYNNSNITWQNCSAISNLNDSKIISSLEDSTYSWQSYGTFVEDVMVDQMDSDKQELSITVAKYLQVSFDLELSPTEVWLISELVGILEYILFFDPLYLLFYIIIDVWFKTCCMRNCSCCTCICRYWCGSKKRHNMLKELSSDVSKDDLMDENEDSKDNDREFTFGSSQLTASNTSKDGGIVMDAEWANSKKDSIVLMAEYFVIAKEYLRKSEPISPVGANL